MNKAQMVRLKQCLLLSQPLFFHVFNIFKERIDHDLLLEVRSQELLIDNKSKVYRIDNGDIGDIQAFQPDGVPFAFPVDVRMYLSGLFTRNTVISVATLAQLFGWWASAEF